MKGRNFFVVGMVVVGIFFVSTCAFALGRPTIIYPKVAYGTGSKSCNTLLQPTFSWTPVEGATWYRIWVAEKSSPGTAVADQWVEAGTSWTFTGYKDKKLTPGTEYTWWVRAWNATEGAGPWSTGEDFTAGHQRALSVNADAFVSSQNGYQYTRSNAGDGLIPGNGSSATWGAPVSLPNGAVVSEVHFFFYNNGDVTTSSQFSLYRSKKDVIDSAEQMAHIEVEKNAGYHTRIDATIAHPTIDNETYSYYLTAELPSANNQLVHMLIYYWN